MDIQFYGANCIVLTAKGVRVVIDDNLANLGGKSVAKPGDIALFTGPVTRLTPKTQPKLIIDHGGEYEVSDISVYGIPARSHMDEADKQTGTMYKLISKEVSILITGHVFPELSDEQLEKIGMIDAMLVPVGGNGYTLDPVGALKLIRKVEPKIVVPTYYDDPNLTFEVPAQTLEQAVTGLSMEPRETTSILKLRPTDLTDITSLVIIKE